MEEKSVPDSNPETTYPCEETEDDIEEEEENSPCCVLGYLIT